jgi:hypothetical protein
MDNKLEKQESVLWSMEAEEDEKEVHVEAREEKKETEPCSDDSEERQAERRMAKKIGQCIQIMKEELAPSLSLMITELKTMEVMPALTKAYGPEAAGAVQKENLAAILTHFGVTPMMAMMAASIYTEDDVQRICDGNAEGYCPGDMMLNAMQLYRDLLQIMQPALHFVVGINNPAAYRSKFTDQVAIAQTAMLLTVQNWRAFSGQEHPLAEERFQIVQAELDKAAKEANEKAQQAQQKA